MHPAEKASAPINGMVDNVEEMDVILREIGQASREQISTVFCDYQRDWFPIRRRQCNKTPALWKSLLPPAASLNEQALAF